MTDPSKDKLDSWIGGLLMSRCDNISRRSLLSKLTRGAFALAGVTLGATVAPLIIPRTASAQGGGGSWDRCGLRGHICGTGNCDCPSTLPPGGACGFGSGIASEWVSCCLNPATSCYHCCYYKDKVSSFAPPAASGCDGPSPSGAQWGGDLNSLGYVYVCTIISCSGKISKNLSDCKCLPVRERPYCGIGPKPADS